MSTSSLSSVPVSDPFDPPLEGILRCSRYAFGPNRLHYCGPDANREILAYINAGFADPGLTAMLARFETMYPYLRTIAEANGIPDPFDERVVEAYWIGNALLERVSQRAFYRHLRETLKLSDRLGPAAFAKLTEKIAHGALPHHTFHVLNIGMRTARGGEFHTLESMDACRVSAGTVRAIDGPFLTVSVEPLTVLNDRLALGEAVERQVMRPFSADAAFDEIAIGDIVSLHWNVPCEILSPTQAAMLRRYTLRSIELANLWK